MDWFLYDSGFHHERVNGLIVYIWQDPKYTCGINPSISNIGISIGINIITKETVDIYVPNLQKYSGRFYF